MMMNLLLWKEKLCTFYRNNDVYILPVIRFAVAFLAFQMLKSTMGTMTILNRLPVLLVSALICSMLPAGTTVLFFCLFLLGHIYAVAMEAAVVSAVLLCLMFFLYYVFKPGDSVILVLTPILFWIRIPYLIPIAAGLFGGLMSAIPVSFGVLIYYLMMLIKQNASALAEGTGVIVLTRFQLVIDQLIGNRVMFAYVAAFMLSTILVYILRRQSFSHSWKIAIGVGVAAEVVGILVVGSVLGISRNTLPILPMIVGAAAAAWIALIFEFVCHSIDYSRTEYVQFEDDEYYYYVKAVPKMVVAPEQKEVKRFAVNEQGRANGLTETVDLGDEVKKLTKIDH